MSECQTGGCNVWVHVLGDGLDTDYCCCIDAEWQLTGHGEIVCGRCELPIYRDISSQKEENNAD